MNETQRNALDRLVDRLPEDKSEAVRLLVDAISAISALDSDVLDSWHCSALLGLVQRSKHSDESALLGLVQRSKHSDELVETADRILRADYFGTVRGIADDIREQTRDEFGNRKPGDVDEDEVREYMDERLHEAVDGSWHCFATLGALRTLVYSDNDSAALDEFGSDVLGDASDGMLFPRLAYFALRADVLDVLDVLDVDEFVDELVDEDEDDEAGSGDS